MNSRHWEILRGTPFYQFMDLAPVLQKRGVLDTILQLYDVEIERFKIGKRRCRFRLDDVALVLDFHYDDEIVSFKHERFPSDFKKAFLQKIHNRHRDAIKDSLLRIAHSGESDEETFVKLLVVYFMAIILFLNTVLNAPAFVEEKQNRSDTLYYVLQGVKLHQGGVD